MKKMKKFKISKVLSIVALTLFLSNCGIDAVENPNVTTDRFTNSPQAASTWINGAKSEMASSLGIIVELTEITSDNYFNNRTLSSKVFDIPQIVNTDLDVDRLQTAVHNIRRTTEFGLETVLPSDPSSTTEDQAELIFLKGVAHLFSGEYFTGIPGENGGPILQTNDHFSIAVSAFEDVIELSNQNDLINAAKLALARIAWHLNDIPTLRSNALQIIENDPLFNFQIEFDGENGPNNAFQFFIFNSPQDEFAPLPRLDFLDPKYFSEDGAGLDQKPITLFKSEEAYLMLAEAELVAGNIATAKSFLVDVLENVIANRPVFEVNDAAETRSGGNRDDYPLVDTFSIKFSPDEPAIDGLVLDRQSGPVQVPGVSGTSVTAQQIDSATNTEDLLEIILLMRQEIFISEGRRVVDLGIKYPVSENEIRSNENIDINDPAGIAQIPGFIPLGTEMDDFINDEENQVITILVNMNKVLVQNRTSEFVLPLW